MLLSTTVEQSSASEVTNIHVACPNISVFVRFPIPDFREVSVQQPWWRRSLREEILSLQLLDAELHTTLTQPTTLTVTCRQIHGTFSSQPCFSVRAIMRNFCQFRDWYRSFHCTIACCSSNIHHSGLSHSVGMRVNIMNIFFTINLLYSTNVWC